MKKGLIKIGEYFLESFFALSEHEQSQGLMFIEPPTPIMSFVYPLPKINKFWMQNTPAPLDIVFCFKNKVSQICYGKPFTTYAIGDNIPSDLVIELPEGSCKKMGIEVGSLVKIL